MDCWVIRREDGASRLLPGNDDYRLSFRDGPKDQTRNLEIPGSRFARPGMTGLNRRPGNDG
jgi:hypothetical protein